MTAKRPWPHVLLALAVTACVLAPGVARAQGLYSITISSTAPTSNGSFSSGNPAVFTPSGADAILNAGDLETQLSQGPVALGDPTSTSLISIDADISSSSPCRSPSRTPSSSAATSRSPRAQAASRSQPRWTERMPSPSTARGS